MQIAASLFFLFSLSLTPLFGATPSWDGNYLPQLGQAPETEFKDLRASQVATAEAARELAFASYKGLRQYDGRRVVGLYRAATTGRARNSQFCGAWRLGLAGFD